MLSKDDREMFGRYEPGKVAADVQEMPRVSGPGVLGNAAAAAVPAGNAAGAAGVLIMCRFSAVFSVIRFRIGAKDPVFVGPVII